MRSIIAAEPPRVSFQPSSLPAEAKSLTISYHGATGPLAGAKRVSLHHGHDGWNDTVDTEMTRLEADEWELRLEVPPTSDRINLCFTDGSKWDNNSGRDWNYITRKPAAP